jgi:hypothetical protein
MSTNAVIRIEGFKTAELYKHWDGNPESTLKWLQDFNEEFTQSRGHDKQYKFAQLIRSSARDAKLYNLDPSLDTGWGVYPVCSASFDYLYRLRKDGTVDVKTRAQIQQ